MKKPIHSFAIALIIWFFSLIIFVYFFFKNSPKIPVSLTIDASEISEESKGSKKSSANKESAKATGLVKKPNPETGSQKNSHAHETSEQDKNQTQLVLKRVLPEIPAELLRETIDTFAIARFIIEADGKVKEVQLIRPSSNPKLNKILLKSLYKWQFSPQSTGSIQDIKVEFLVK